IVGSGIEKGPKAFDINDDGKLELFVGADKVYGFNYTGALLEGFPLEDGNYFRATLAIDDLEGDGHYEIVGHTSGDRKLHVWNLSNRELLWSKNTYSGIAISSPLIADLDNDGKKEIVTGASDTHLYAWYHNGTEVIDGDNDPSTDGVFATINEMYSYGSPSVGDIDMDGNLEIFWTSGRGENLYAWHHDGTELLDGDNNASTLGVFKELGQEVNSNPVIVDLDGDEVPEIVVNTVGKLFVLKNDSSVLLEKSIGLTPQGPTSSAAIGDLDGNGTLDIIIGNSNGIYAFSIDGDALEGWPVAVGGKVLSSVVLADINQDNNLEVIVGSDDKNLYGFYNDGTLIQGFPIETGEAITGSPLVADLDNDSDVELVFVSRDSVIYIFDLDGLYDESLVTWGEDMFNPQNTGRFYYSCDNEFICGEWSDPSKECGTRECDCWCIGEIGCEGDGIESVDCPSIPSPSGDGGGGGGGVLIPPCVENWTCNNWLPCVDGIQVRRCTDLNNCSTNESMPILERDCGTGLENQSLNQSINESLDNITENETEPEEELSQVFEEVFTRNIYVIIGYIVLVAFFIFLGVRKMFKKKRVSKKANAILLLENYIAKGLALNKSPEYLIENLKRVGWPEEYVRDKIKEVGKDEALQTR
ncbi:MAG: VCBS repeat-containing protein, partial [archaeon]